MFTNEENLTTKTPSGDFQVTTFETPLLSQQTVTTKGIPSTLPTYSWNLISISNWTCSVVTVPIFYARLPVRDFSHQLKRLSAAKLQQSKGCYEVSHILELVQRSKLCIGIRTSNWLVTYLGVVHQKGKLSLQNKSNWILG